MSDSQPSLPGNQAVDQLLVDLGLFGLTMGDFRHVMSISWFLILASRPADL
jgi:hypothetical protein